MQRLYRNNYNTLHDLFQHVTVRHKDEVIRGSKAFNETKIKTFGERRMFWFCVGILILAFHLGLD